jgi:hypothetical protein
MYSGRASTVRNRSSEDARAAAANNRGCVKINSPSVAHFFLLRKWRSPASNSPQPDHKNTTSCTHFSQKSPAKHHKTITPKNIR